MTQLLDDGQLRLFERLLREQDAPIDEWTRPGLSDDEIDATMAGITMRLPQEARVWWRWRNGVIHGGERKLPGSWRRSLALDRALDEYRSLRQVAHNTAHDWPQNDPDVIWHPNWLPILGTDQPTAIDCSGSEDAPAPVLFVDWSRLDRDHKPLFDQPRAASIGEMVEWWIVALESGAWYWSQQDGWWRTRAERLDPALRTNPLL